MDIQTSFHVQHIISQKVYLKQCSALYNVKVTLVMNTIPEPVLLSFQVLRSLSYLLSFCKPMADNRKILDWRIS